MQNIEFSLDQSLVKDLIDKAIQHVAHPEDNIEFSSMDRHILSELIAGDMYDIRLGPVSNDRLAEDIVDRYGRDRKYIIKAIKEFRSLRPELGLREAKEVIEKFMPPRDMPSY